MDFEHARPLASLIARFANYLTASNYDYHQVVKWATRLSDLVIEGVATRYSLDEPTHEKPIPEIEANYGARFDAVALMATLVKLVIHPHSNVSFNALLAWTPDWIAFTVCPDTIDWKALRNRRLGQIRIRFRDFTDEDSKRLAKALEVGYLAAHWFFVPLASLKE
ncbi:hypothetical protein KJ596_01005 [Patescibacteria group bacterium]|nr:hypothetical protein [Patescibacteria group bacterium]